MGSDNEDEEEKADKKWQVTARRGNCSERRAREGGEGRAESRQPKAVVIRLLNTWCSLEIKVSIWVAFGCAGRRIHPRQEGDACPDNRGGEKETQLGFTEWGCEADGAHDLPETTREALVELKTETCSPQASLCKAAVSFLFCFSISFFCLSL